MMKVYNFIKDGCSTCERNTKLLNRIVGLDVIDVIPESCISLVDKYEVCMTPTMVFENANGDVVAKETGEISIDKLDQIMYLEN